MLDAGHPLIAGLADKWMKNRHAHYRNDHLFVIRDKTPGDSEMAFIKIALTEQIEDIRRRSLRLDWIASPYLVHRAPDRSRREWTSS